MKIIRGLHNIHQYQHSACALAIGNFDGVHLGHQALLKGLVEQSRQLKLPSVVMTFEPSAKEYFSNDKSTIPARLTRAREKYLAIKRCGIDVLLIVKFNQTFSQLTADEFVEKLLVQSLKIKALMIGEDFRFGFQRQGDLQFLQQAGKQYDFDVHTMLPLLIDNRRVSSTWIRECLQHNDLSTAEKLLGAPYSMLGRVVHGEKLGRQLGFPTANIYLHRAKTPVHGIYAVKIYGIGQRVLYGAANVGERPTVGGTSTLLEVYIFDFDEEIYGREVRVEFVHKIRDEERYESLDVLKAQIARDVEAVKRWFYGLSFSRRRGSSTK